MRCGVTVEGVLGVSQAIVGDDAANGAEEAEQAGDTVYTSVAEAEAYAERTGVDCLAVSVGTVHGHVRRRPKLDFERLRKIRSAVSLPLVIHGGSGLSNDQYRRLIQCGVARSTTLRPWLTSPRTAFAAIAAQTPAAGIQPWCPTCVPASARRWSAVCVCGARPAAPPRS